jgi:hypothetical protein
VNKRFEALADKERENQKERGDRRRDLGPPEPTNSRFAAAADADRSMSYRSEDLGPPPVQNSRFAAVADADRADRLPPAPRGPPPVQNSRFAAAAAESEREQSDLNDRRRDRDNAFSRDSGPPPVQNSRFAAAVAADEDYVPEDRRRAPAPQDRFADNGGGGRFDDDRRGGGGGGYDDRRGGGGYDDRRGGGGGGYDDRRGGGGGGYDDRRGGGGGGYDDRRGGGGGGYDDRRGGGGGGYEDRRGVSDLLKPKERPTDKNTLKVPDAAIHSDNMFKMPTTTKTKAEREEEAIQKEKAEASTKRAAAAEAKAAEAATNAAAHKDLLADFSSGSKLGEDLKSWCAEKGAALPPVESLVFEMLMANEQKNPDPECAWAAESKYGAALVSLVDDDIYGQMQVLWGVQKVRNSVCRDRNVAPICLLKMMNNSTATNWDSLNSMMSIWFNQCTALCTSSTLQQTMLLLNGRTMNPTNTPMVS